MRRNKILAVLSYLNFLVIVPLFIKDKDEFVKRHLKQGLFLSLAFVLLPYVLIIPLLGWVVGAVWFTIWLVLWLIALISAILGKVRPIPLVGKFLLKIAI